MPLKRWGTLLLVVCFSLWPGHCLILFTATILWPLLLPGLLAWAAMTYKWGFCGFAAFPVLVVSALFGVRILAEILDAADWRIMLALNLCVWYFSAALINIHQKTMRRLKKEPSP